MSRVELLTAESLKEFLAARVSVLMLAKTGCPACAEWTAELEQYLASDKRFLDVRFGKLFLDQPALGEFKRANAWLREVDGLPYNVIYIHGERRKSWPGGGTERLESRLTRLLESAQ